MYIDALLEPRAYPHPVTDIQLKETFISWILLTGDYAYKIKKPRKLPFLDFSTLRLRQHYCNEELRLNRRLAPQLYLQVIGLYGDEHNPTLTGKGAVIEYAVKMRQFRKEDQLDERLARKGLSALTIDESAEYIYRYYSASLPAQQRDFDEPGEIVRPVLDSFQPSMTSGFPAGEINQLRHWGRREETRLTTHFRQRKANGHVRQLHGDLHLGKIAYYDNQLLAFDCVEFDPRLRYIDIINEISILFLDLLVHERTDYAYRFLNRFLECSGDYAGMALLRYYAVYRAITRAKRHLLSMQELQGPMADQHSLSLQRHIAVASALTRQQHAGLIIMCGLAGSGKSTVAAQLMCHLPAIRIGFDLERKRLQNPVAVTSSQSGINTSIYGPRSTDLLHGQFETYVELLTKNQFTVILDAPFLRPEKRLQFRQLAQRLDIPFAIVWCDADAATLRQRVIARGARRPDPSVANINVLEYQLRHSRLPNSDKDTTGLLHFHTSGKLDISELARLLF